MSFAVSAAEPAPNYWSGLSVGAGISVWGGKGVKGGVGGETDLNYEHVFDNGIMLGVQVPISRMEEGERFFENLG